MDGAVGRNEKSRVATLYEMASSSEEVLTCKPRCKLHRASFEEAFVEDIRS